MTLNTLILYYRKDPWNRKGLRGYQLLAVDVMVKALSNDRFRRG